MRYSLVLFSLLVPAVGYTYLGDATLPLQISISSNSVIGISTVTFNGTAQPVNGIGSFTTTPGTGTASVNGGGFGSFTITPGTGSFTVNSHAVTQGVQAFNIVSTTTLAISAIPASNTFTVTPGTGTFTVQGPTLTKGTQGATGFSTQDLKDSGRVHVNYYVSASTVGATTVESALTFTKASGTSATSSGYTFVITSGKRYRIESITVASQGNAVATAQTTTFSFRANAAGNCTTASTPVMWKAKTATPATASAWDRPPVFIFPEGWEIAGDGTLQICASVNSVYVANAPTADMIIAGYEY